MTISKAVRLLYNFTQDYYDTPIDNFDTLLINYARKHCVNVKTLTYKLEVAHAKKLFILDETSQIIGTSVELSESLYAYEYDREKQTHNIVIALIGSVLGSIVTTIGFLLDKFL